MKYLNHYLIHAVMLAVLLLYITQLAHAGVVQIEYQYEQSQHQVVPSNNMTTAIPVRAATVYAAGVVGKQLQVLVHHDTGALVDSFLSDTLQLSDAFTVEGTEYKGLALPISVPGDALYTVTVNVIEKHSTQSQSISQLLVDSAPAQINGEFFWNSIAGTHHGIHSDGLYIVSLNQLSEGGFSDVVEPPSGVKSATFSAEFLDGAMQGTVYADRLPAELTSANVVRIGNGTPNSITPFYIPNNTSAKMRLTFSLETKAGVMTTRTQDVYVATKLPAQAPEPYGVFTGQNVALDGNNAFAGFVAYESNMVVLSNPVRMIYRAARQEYYGGGGDADIYGAWLGTSTRSLSNVVHTDENYVYYDIIATSLGHQFEPAAASVSHFSQTQSAMLTHSLTLNGESTPPSIVNVSYYLANRADWVTGLAAKQSYTNHAIGNDTITQVKVEAEIRPYLQTFTYANHGHNQTCTIEPGNKECSVAINLAYPNLLSGDYFNDFTLYAPTKNMMSAPYNAQWHYDGLETQLDAQPVAISTDNKTLTVQLKKLYTDASLGNASILNVSPYVVTTSNTKPQNPIYLAPNNAPLSSNIDNAVHFVGHYDLSVLPSDEYDVYVYVEDGFATLKHSQTHHLITHNIPDNDAPVIQASITENQTVTSLKDIQFDLIDDNESSLDSMVISGGPSAVNLNASILSLGDNNYQPDQIYIVESSSTPYTVTVQASDSFNNTSLASITFFYSPETVILPTNTLPAIASALRSQNGRPHNVILTPPIRNTQNELARGVHTVYFTLNANAPAPFYINSQLVNPGATISLQQNLTANNHRLRIEAYPATTGVEAGFDYTVHFPALNVSVCPESFSQNQSTCTLIDIKPSNIMCPSPFGYNQLENECQWVETYPLEASCKAGYIRDDLTCSSVISVAKITTCEAGTGLSKDKLSCEKRHTVQAELCGPTATFEDGLCKVGESFTPTGLYCAGNDVSGGAHCDSGVCYTYNPQWNACEVVTSTPMTSKCVEGVDNGLDCLLTHSYQLNATCEFGFIRNDLTCSRLVIQEPDKQCPVSYDLTPDGTSCINTTFSNFTSCPDSTHEFINGRCYELANVEILCPDQSYTWTGVTCEKVISYNAQATCPTSQGWSDSGQNCEYLDIQEAASCEDGYLLSSGDCFQIISANEVCPHQYVQNQQTGICEYQNTIAIDGCPQPYEEINGQCFEVIDAQQECSSPGYVVDNGVCRKSLTTAIVSCDAPNTTLIDGRCHAVTPAVPFCTLPSEIGPDGDVCVSEDIAPIIGCPTTHLQDGNDCFEIVNATQVCPQGWLKDSDSGQCNQVIETHVVSCPSTHEFNVDSGYCFQMSIPVEQCDQPGYTNDGNGFCSKVETESIVSCQSGYELVNGSCFATQAPTTGCQSGYYLSSDGQCRNGSGPASPTLGCTSGTYTFGSCFQTAYTDSFVGCFNATSIISGATYGKDKVGPFNSGDSRADVLAAIEGKSCLNTSAPSPISSMSGWNEGYDFDLYWVPTSTVRINKNSTECPSTHPVEVSDSWGNPKCWRSSEDASLVDYQGMATKTSANTVCPSGSTWHSSFEGKSLFHSEQCVADSGASVSINNGSCKLSGYNYSGSTGLCTKVTTSQPVTQCTGMTTMIDNMCEGAITAEVQYSCSDPSTHNYNSILGQCVSVSATMTAGVCSSIDAVLNTETGLCENTMTMPVVLDCGFESQLNASQQCVSFIPDFSVGQCATLEQSLDSSTGRCKEAFSQPIDYQCNPTHSLYNGSQCKANSAELVGLCATSYDLDAATGLCTAEISTSLDYQCTNPLYAIHNQTNCAAIQASLNIGTCPELYTLDTATGVCQQDLFDPIVYTCLTSYSGFGLNQCKADSPSLTVGVCSEDGYSVNPVTGLCDIYLTTGVSYECNTQAGFSLYESNQCLASLPTFTAGECLDPTSHAIDPTTGDCVDTTTVDYTYQCAPSFNGEPVTRNSTTCTHMAYQQEMRGCSDNFSLVNINSCRKDTPSAFVGVCPEAFEVGEQSCSLTTLQNYSLHCSDSSFILNEGQCSKLESGDLSVSCQADEQQVEDSCQFTKAASKTPYCDAPYESKGSALCERKVTINSL